MSTKIRPEISKRNKYWISKHRYYELKHFCLQYPEWKEAMSNSIRYSKQTTEMLRTNIEWSDPTSTVFHIREEAGDKIRKVEKCAHAASDELGDYILMAVTQGLSFTSLKMIHGLPCERDMYYDCYRRFFWLLSNL